MNLTHTEGMAARRVDAQLQRFRRAMWDVSTVFDNMPRAVQGLPPKPARPYPRDISRMTAREYRARRRRYARELSAWRKATREAEARGTDLNWPLITELARASARARRSQP